MVIAINITNWSEDFESWNGFYLSPTIQGLSEQFPSAQFLLITDRILTVKKTWPANVKQLSVRPVAKNLFRLRYWLDFCIPKVLRKHKVDLFISVRYCSLRTKVPQLLIIDDLSFLHFPKELKRFDRIVFKQTWLKQLQIATQLFSASALIKKELVEGHGVNEAKIILLPSSPASTFQKLHETNSAQRASEKSLIKNRFTEGKEFFLCGGDDTERLNIMGALKAFSLFKKRQQTGFKLVLSFNEKDSLDRIKKKVATYKYREDVVLLLNDTIKNFHQIVDAAYAWIHPATYESASPQLVNALFAGTPCIVGKETAMQEIVDHAGLFVEPAAIQDLANKMMLIYKDETLRDKLISNGNDRLLLFSQQSTTHSLAQAIKNIVQ